MSLSDETAKVREERVIDDAPKPSGGLAAMAAIVPWIFALIGCGALVVVARGPARGARMLEDGGTPALLVLGASLVALVLLSLLLWLAATRRPIPAFVPLGVACFPWMVGVGAGLSALVTAGAAAAAADPSSRASAIALGISESLTSRTLGAWCTGGLAASVALGLAFAALALRARGRGGGGVGVGLVAAVPIIAAAAFALLTSLDLRAMLVVTLLPALLAPVALMMAGGAIGKDDESARSASVSASVALAAGLALVCALVVGLCQQTVNVFSAIASTDPDSRAHSIAMAALELEPTRNALLTALGATVLASVPLAVLGIARTRLSIGRVVGALFALAVVAVGVVVDDLAARQAGTLLLAAAPEPWPPIDGFVPVLARGEDRLDVDAEAQATIGTRAVVDGRGQPSPFSQPSFAAATRARPIEPLAWGPHGDLSDQQMLATPQIVLAVDGRLDAATLRSIATWSSAAGAHSLQLVGWPPDMLPEDLAVIERNLPMMSPFVRSTTRTRVLLESVVPPSQAAADPLLLHGTVGASTVVEIRPRAGNATTPFRIDGRGGPSIGDSGFAAIDDEGMPRVLLALGPDATAQSFVAVASALRRRGHEVVLVAGEFPGHPERPVREEPQQLTFGGAPETTILGSISRDAIQRVIRAHVADVRRCYERGLAREPTLTGRVTISFVINATGSVASSEVEDTTLGSPDVEQCIRQRVATWEFPAPLGGGIVRVRYPFALSPSR